MFEITQDDLGSEPFRFLVGPQGSLISVHAALIKKHSRPLARLIEGPMREAREGVAPLECVDKETFLRFSQWVYSGRYSPASPGIRFEDDQEQDMRPASSYQSMRVSFDLDPSNNGDRSSEEPPDYFGDIEPRSVWKEFEDLCCLNDESLNNEHSDCEDNHIANHNKDFVPVFLSHAQVYVFADCYDIPSLADYSLLRLKRCLLRSKLYPDRVSDVVELARFAFDNGNTKDTAIGEKEDNLRRVMSLYITCIYESMIKSRKFLAFLEGNGQFAKSLAVRLWDRIRDGDGLNTRVAGPAQFSEHHQSPAPSVTSESMTSESLALSHSSS